MNNIEANILFNEYNHLSRRQLKKVLKQLKNDVTPTSLDRVKYISKLIRLKYSKKTRRFLNADPTHNDRIEKNFWQYCRDVFENDERILPKFDEDTCREYFKNTLKKSSTNQRSFNLPSWMKELPENTTDFNMLAPSYQELTKIIKKMKSSGSACPFDQISVLALKRCPILRTALHRIISQGIFVIL